mgnify:CR=1 FL=1
MSCGAASTAEQEPTRRGGSHETSVERALLGGDASSCELAFCEAEDEGALPPDVQPAGRVELHIVHSAAYGTPMLLLQGYCAHGQPWGADEVHTHLAHCSPPGSIAAEMVSQVEHPSLHVPFFAIHPCRTAEWMGTLLHRTDDAYTQPPCAEAVSTRGGAALPGEAGVLSPHRGGDGNAQLDYLSAWWAVVAPLVGASVSASEAQRALREQPGKDIAGLDFEHAVTETDPSPPGSRLVAAG